MLLASGAAWLTGACSDSTDRTQGIRAALRFEPAPHVGTVHCTVALTDASGDLAACTDVELEATMNHAGMVPVFASAHPEGDGVFTSTLEFTMGGDWILFVRGKTDDGRAFETVSDVPGVRHLPKTAAPDSVPAPGPGE
ncbi:hypothetical protein Poly30_01400 [Planctomycetes bacterium Poly30]|uniref:YtkA-like domain-containing protein n=2 Tax=Saltatorellus ferox TaxID=2528018 RepID=A0A518EKN3_9BACT|nr:hypothetical protein Poly30_01400 [Planctomycetes bacterium Poly30]